MTVLSGSACGCDAAEGPGLISVAEAARIAVELAAPLGESETLPLYSAFGRVLAADLHAPRAMPFFDNSAVDGFAIRCAALSGDGPWPLPVLATLAAGGGLDPALEGRAGALRIATGAPVPPGFDAVLMRETCEDRGDAVVLYERPSPGRNIRRAGEDLAEGDLLVAAGTPLEARHMGLLAANGYRSVSVRRAPRIAVVSTGDELLAGNSGNPAARIHDANRPMLLALCAAAGASVADLGICRDDRDETARLLRDNAGAFDLILTSGAASAGDRDFVRSALMAAGGAVHSCSVALKPGKPVFFGQLGGTLVTGLPGNPLAAYIGFQLFVSRQIDALLGLEPADPPDVAEPAVAGFDWNGKPGRTEYLPVRLTGKDAAGRPVLQRLGTGGSASLAPLATADGVAVLAAGAVRGAPVGWFPFRARRAGWTFT